MLDALDVFAWFVGTVVAAAIIFLSGLVGGILVENSVTTQCETFGAFRLGEKVYECKRRTP